jgi:signal transduction histidine kinase
MLEPFEADAGDYDIMNAVRQDERRKVARELHDTVVQPLASLNMSLTLFEHQPDAATSIETLIGLWRREAHEALDSLRSTLAGIPWQTSTGPDLVESLQRRLLPELKQHGITLTIEKRVWPMGLPQEWGSQLYLITREALTNVVKHACASEVHITLDSDPEYLAIFIEDNGAGFRWEDQVLQTPQAGGNGWGIVCMQERVKALGGRLEISTVPSKGTRIELILPNTTMSNGSRVTQGIA